MLRIVLFRPGATDFDQQGRIKGTLDIPLNAEGSLQVARTAHELRDEGIGVIYCSPCRAAEQTAEILGANWRVRVKRVPGLRNLNHGLWQGKLIAELKDNQRKVYRQWQEQPETVCPPEGEMLKSARARISHSLEKLVRKHRSGVVGIVVPEPLATLVRAYLEKSAVGDLWKAERNCGNWEAIEVESESWLAMSPPATSL